MMKNAYSGKYLFDNKALVSLILPLVVEQLLAVLVGMADYIMIACVWEAAVSWVSMVYYIKFLLIYIIVTFSFGGSFVVILILRFM